jgi:hypothetical protein
MYFNNTSLHNRLTWPKIGMVAHDISICRVPFNFVDHDLDNSMPNFGGIGPRLGFEEILVRFDHFLEFEELRSWISLVLWDLWTHHAVLRVL